MIKFSKGEAIVQSMKNVFPVADTIPEGDRMKIGESVVITVKEVVDQVNRKIKVIINEAKGFAEGEEVVTFAPTALFNLINADDKHIGEPIMVEYQGMVMAKEKNAKTGTKCKYHNFKIFEVKEKG